MSQLSHKDMTKHLRNRLRVAGVKAHCSMYATCGERFIRVSVPEFGAQFTDEQQRSIRFIAKCNGLTRSRGMEIDVDQMTDPQELHLVYPY